MRYRFMHIGQANLPNLARTDSGAFGVCRQCGEAAREDVAVPLGWHEFSTALRSDRYYIADLHRRLAALRTDPWEEFEAARRPLRREMRWIVGSD